MEKPLMALPRVTAETLTYEDRGQLRSICIGTPYWYDWLKTATVFSFADDTRTFTAHRTRAGNRRGGWYWRASRWSHGRNFRCYLGVSSNLTWSCLQKAARRLTMRIENESYRQAKEPEKPIISARDASMPPLLVQTKCAIPRLPVVHVSRTRLVALLEKGALLPLTLVSAPAGSGKTTLLAEWAHTTALPVTWLSLEAADRDPVRFLSSILIALNKLDIRIGQKSKPLLHTQPMPDVERFLSKLSNELTSFLTTDAVLVLDDYQVLESATIDACLHFLLNHLPQRLHLILGTRVDPSLPLARLRAHRHIHEISAEALHFVPIEIQFFLQQMEVDLSEEELARLEERTEGWIAGVQLAALALRGRTDSPVFLRDFRGIHRLLLAYINEEILARLTPHIRSFLLRTSILKHLSGPLCDAVTEREDSALLLEDLRKANLFVSALDETGEWYRYHPLFAEALHHLFTQHEPEQLQEAYTRASIWYETQNLLIEACNYALQANNLSRAVPLMERQIGRLIEQAQFAVFGHWLARVPSDIIAASPLLSVAATLTRFAEDQQLEHLQQTEAFLQQRFPRPQKERDLILWAEARTQLGFLLVLQALDENDVTHALALAQQTWNDLPEEATSLRIQASLCLSLTQGMVFRSRGDFAEATHILSEAVRRVQSTAYHYLNLVIMGSLAEIYGARGELRKSAQLYQRFLYLFRERPETPPDLVAGISLNYASLLVEWNQLEQAEEILTQSLTTVQVKEFRLDAYFLRLRLCQIRGQYEDAWTWLQKIEKVLTEMPLAHPMAGLAIAAQARLLLIQNRADDAALYLHQWNLHDDDPFPDHPLQEPPAEGEVRFTQAMILARVLIAQGRVSPTAIQLSQALTILDRAYTLSEKAGLIRWVIEILLLMSLALHAQGKTQTALARLEQAVHLAEAGGFVRLFADESENLARLLARLPIQKPATTAYLRLLQAALHAPQLIQKQESRSELLDPLTPRETEVLWLMATGASNQDIAIQLVIAPNTVKRHVKHILAKLAVANRIQAVTRARELHLL